MLDGPVLPLLTARAPTVAGCVMGAPRACVSYWTKIPIMCVSYNGLPNPLNLPMARPPVPASKPQRGRPRDPERVRRILEAAQRHFNEHGLERASVDAIAADAGVSKMTVYNNFGSKERLFQAIVRDRTAPVVAGVPGAGALDPDEPEQALLAIGGRFLALTRGDDALGALRAVYGVAGAQPEACRTFYKDGPERVKSELAAYLRRANSAGTLKVRNPLQAADLFLSMFLGSGHMRGLLKLEMPDTRENRALLREAVRVFLAAYGA
ncbi:Transcriptional regulator [Cupriavidus taiwanensis]|nr:Transcriptional regulator [Cupriavidus taiwanensis]SOY65351.1 Transcriptional regulator [Cupriavidus taiwanensis]SOY94186.1 Transcriptional regulator [Cupriavidus taiwanensis]SOZ69757.1 Transcriptional regulator [Cupriavidus taiwanensis]SOZ85827.1 Transcriptional regulator [Cupriavidus taiwanensis]